MSFPAVKIMGLIKTKIDADTAEAIAAAAHPARGGSVTGVIFKFTGLDSMWRPRSDD